jgi:hypothetical protein
MCEIHSADLRKGSRACFCGHGDYYFSTATAINY